MVVGSAVAAVTGALAGAVAVAVIVVLAAAGAVAAELRIFRIIQPYPIHLPQYRSQRMPNWGLLRPHFGEE